MIPRDWLIKKVDIKAAEAENTSGNPNKISKSDGEELPYDPILDLPFGYINEEWQKIISKLLVSDELWTFRNSDAEWRALCGRAGIAVVRDGDVVDLLLTEMS